MRGAHDGADAGFAFWHRGECDTGGEDTVLEQLARELHRQPPFPHDDGCDRGFARRCVLPADVEAQRTKFFFEKARVLPQPFDALRLLFEYFKRSNACGCDGWRMRS